MSDDNEHAKGNARAWLARVIEMTARLNSDDDDASDKARDEIQESPLSVQVRGDWRSPGEKNTDAEYEILLSTGGPALRIVGDLSDHGEPETATLEWQDWGTPWTEHRPTTDEDGAAVLAFAGCFYFGE